MAHGSLNDIRTSYGDDRKDKIISERPDDAESKSVELPCKLNTLAALFGQGDGKEGGKYLGHEETAIRVPIELKTGPAEWTGFVGCSCGAKCVLSAHSIIFFYSNIIVPQFTISANRFGTLHGIPLEGAQGVNSLCGLLILVFPTLSLDLFLN